MANMYHIICNILKTKKIISSSLMNRVTPCAQPTTPATRENHRKIRWRTGVSAWEKDPRQLEKTPQGAPKPTTQASKIVLRKSSYFNLKIF
jgi:hypothetical protein